MSLLFQQMTKLSLGRTPNSHMEHLMIPSTKSVPGNIKAVPK